VSPIKEIDQVLNLIERDLWEIKCNTEVAQARVRKVKNLLTICKKEETNEREDTTKQ